MNRYLAQGIRVRGWGVLLLWLPAAFGAPPARGLSARRIVADTLAGTVLYWRTPAFVPETLAVDATVSSPHLSLPDDAPRSHRDLCGHLNQNGFSLFSVRRPSAMAVAVLTRAGFDTFVLSQWVGTTRQQISLAVPGFRHEYRKRTLVSDFLWERVKSVDIREAAGIDTRRRVRMDLSGGGFGLYDGIEEMGKNLPRIEGLNDAIVLDYDAPGTKMHAQGGASGEEVEINRNCVAVFVIASDSTGTRDIVAEIEGAMDELGLDLSYRIPEIEPVSCRPE